MTRRGLALARQIALLAALAALALSLSGDRTSAAGVPATIYGQDPLEVLELKVRPNVIVVLDSSGSMTNTVTEQANTGSGDHPRSKIFQGKAVIQQIVQANQDKVSFMFGTYTGNGITYNNLTEGRNRFQYTTSVMPSPELTVTRAMGDPVRSWAVSSMTRSGSTVTVTTSAPHPFTTGMRVTIVGANETDYDNRWTITVTGPSTFTFNIGTATPATPATGTIRVRLPDGLQSWQIMYPQWSTLYFEESASPNATCTATLSGTPKFYASGASLAADLAAAMVGASCTGNARANTYAVSYNLTSGVFTFSRTGSRNFRILWAQTPNNIRNALAETNASTTSWGTAISTDGPWTLMYRTTTGTADLTAYPFRNAMDTQFRFTETISGVNTVFYQLAVGRLWNGETVYVTPNGEACNMTFATAKTNPPKVTLVAADASCNATATAPRAVFEFAGGDYSFAGDGCSGFRMKSPLVPCDLQYPPATTQIEQVNPYLERGLPFNPTSGTDAQGHPFSVGEPRDITTNDATGDYDNTSGTYGANYDKPDGIPDYVERMDGGWSVETLKLAPSAKHGSWTPIANSLIDIKGLPGDNNCLINPRPPAGTYDSLAAAPQFGACERRGFAKLWYDGQDGTTAMAGPSPWHLDPIRNHRNPKEKTIVLFVTDGDDTCGLRGDTHDDSNMDNNARRAAYQAARLYERLEPDQPASSVQTYVVGYGGAFSGGEPYRLNWIAWGGSGLDQPGLDIVDDGVRWTDTTANIKTMRASCTTCTDAFIAPDAATLATQLQAIIDQGASDGEFNAQQSITESVFEYVKLALATTTAGDADVPTERYKGITPTRYVSSFKLPGFKGQLRAIQDVGPALDPDPCDGTGQCKWEAGGKLWKKVHDAMDTCTIAANSVQGECALPDLYGQLGLTNPEGTSAKIQRRIYTANRNGVYAFTPATLMAGTSTERVMLWPPFGGFPSGNDFSNCATLPGGTACSLDLALGLPPNTPTSYPPGSSCVSPKSYDQCWLEKLQKEHKACLGLTANMPAGCVSTTVNTKMRAARREARDIVLAFMAGATPVPESTGWKRLSSGSNRQQLLFKARDWILADSELATAAVVSQPVQAEPAAAKQYVDEYRLFRDGTRDPTGKSADPSGIQIRKGFGLSNPDNDFTVGAGEPDPRTGLKPVMTVVYAPANDMLHAFRAGPNCASITGCLEGGGEELWGFVPFDQLEALRLRAVNDPQGRDNHVYMLARGIRFGDVFVPGAMTNVDVGNVTVPSMDGVWRRILYFGRGIGGKYVTALDVTAPGPYTATALSTTAPIPLWNRGNPDTQNGLPNGSANGSQTDYDAYLTMGETWSMPTLAFVNPDKGFDEYKTSRRPDGVQFALFMGSGYGDPNAVPRQGTTLYTLDALSGDVVAKKDVEEVASANGLTRTGIPYANAIVANAVGFNRSAFAAVADTDYNTRTNLHPWSYTTARVYVGDLYGRLWKILTRFPGTVIPAADLGADQPIGTAVALLGQDLDPTAPPTGDANPADTRIPNIFVTTGNDQRASGPFRNFSILDAGASDEDTATTGTSSYTNPSDATATFTTFLPVKPQFARTFDQGTPDAECGYPTEAVFRGTIQPTSSMGCDGSVVGGKCQGAVTQVAFYGGTRLSLPNTRFAPPTPLSCSAGEYPCRSQFDTILYVLGVKTGQEAYDLNASGDDAYRIFRDSRIAAISIDADPDPGRGGSRFSTDEGLMKGVPKPPPPPGIPPTTTSATASVVLKRVPGQPAPVVQYGSTVCQ